MPPHHHPARRVSGGGNKRQSKAGCEVAHCTPLTQAIGERGKGKGKGKGEIKPPCWFNI